MIARDQSAGQEIVRGQDSEERIEPRRHEEDVFVSSFQISDFILCPLSVIFLLKLLYGRVNTSVKCAASCALGDGTAQLPANGFGREPIDLVVSGDCLNFTPLIDPNGVRSTFAFQPAPVRCQVGKKLFALHV